MKMEMEMEKLNKITINLKNLSDSDLESLKKEISRILKIEVPDFQFNHKVMSELKEGCVYRITNSYKTEDFIFKYLMTDGDRNKDYFTLLNLNQLKGDENVRSKELETSYKHENDSYRVDLTNFLEDHAFDEKTETFNLIAGSLKDYYEGNLIEDASTSPKTTINDLNIGDKFKFSDGDSSIYTVVSNESDCKMVLSLTDYTLSESNDKEVILV